MLGLSTISGRRRNSTNRLVVQQFEFRRSVKEPVANARGTDVAARTTCHIVPLRILTSAGTVANRWSRESVSTASVSDRVLSFMGHVVRWTARLVATWAPGHQDDFLCKALRIKSRTRFRRCPA